MSAAVVQAGVQSPLMRGVQRTVDSSRMLLACWRRGRALSPAAMPDGVLASNEHGVYCVPRASTRRPLSRAILAGEVWERDTLELLRSADPAGDVVHAGTFFGDFLPALARSREDGALVWAFEPCRESFRCAQMTTTLNDLPDVVLRHAALGDSGGAALLASGTRAEPAFGGASHLVEDPAELENCSSHEEVDLLAIDEVIASDRHVAVIQLDVDGHEQLALEGAMLTVARCRPLIVLESAPPRDWVAEHLAPLGYRMSDPVDANVVLRCA